MMKKTLAFLLCLIAFALATAQVPRVTPSQMEPHTGFVRKAFCSAGDTPTCDSEPPIAPLTPAFCGVAFSTSGSRNTNAAVTNAAYTGDGTRVDFGFTYLIRHESNLIVTVGGVTKSLTTDYSVAYSPLAPGGTVTFVVAPAAGSTVTIRVPSISTRGMRYVLPSFQALGAAGYNGAGGDIQGATSEPNRQGQCEISFIMGAPGPQSWLSLAMDGVANVDRFTSFWMGAFDMFVGFIDIPYRSGATFSVWYNGTSWLVRHGAPSVLEHLNLGQLAANGQGRLFVVGSAPPWWTAGNIVGGIAFCPVNGRGMIGQGNGGAQLHLLPGSCLFKTNDTTNTAASWITMEGQGSVRVEGIAQGAAYPAGTAPNGEQYAAGNYVVVKTQNLTSFYSGNVFAITNLRSNLGTALNGKWIAKRLTPGVDTGCAAGELCVELHQRVDVGNGLNKEEPYGAPSKFIAGDALSLAPVVGAYYEALEEVGVAASARKTDRVSGADYVSSGRSTVVGLARRLIGVGYQDSVTDRNVTSAFNAMQKKCQKTTAADRTTSSASFVEVNADLRCNFVYLNGTSAVAASLGDQGRRVPYTMTVAASNNTAGAGCEFAASFDAGLTPESEVVGFTNPAGVSGGKQTVTISGTKNSLTDGFHFATVLVRAVGGGACTVYTAGTYNTSYHWQ